MEIYDNDDGDDDDSDAGIEVEDDEEIEESMPPKGGVSSAGMQCIMKLTTAFSSVSMSIEQPACTCTYENHEHYRFSTWEQSG